MSKDTTKYTINNHTKIDNNNDTTNVTSNDIITKDKTGTTANPPATLHRVSSTIIHDENEGLLEVSGTINVSVADLFDIIRNITKPLEDKILALEERIAKMEDQKEDRTEDLVDPKIERIVNLMGQIKMMKMRRNLSSSGMERYSFQYDGYRMDEDDTKRRSTSET